MIPNFSATTNDMRKYSLPHKCFIFELRKKICLKVIIPQTYTAASSCANYTFTVQLQ
jgi:hypothetical protein